MKYSILLAAVVIQVCLGGLYAWSSFVPALHSGYGLSTAQTQILFGGLISVFTTTMVFAGRVLQKHGPRVVAAVGGILFAAGHLLASISGGSFWLLLGGITLVSGIGTGFCYVCPLAVCAQWFPARKGLVTGVAVAGFGGGAVLLSAVAEVLFTRGWDVLAVWRWVGLSYGAAICLAAVVLRVPPGLAVVRARPNPSLRALLRNRFVWALLVGMFCGTFAGLLVIGNLKSMALSNGLMPTMAAVAISAFAVGNASGRVTWGWVADRMGLGVVLLTLSFLAAALLLLVPTSASPATFLVASVLTGFGFGACFVVYVTLIGSRYGPQRVASVYPLVFLAYGISGVAGPWAGGLLYDATASHTPGIALSVAVVAVGLALNVWLLRGLWPVGASAFVAASVPLESGGNEDEQGCRLNRHGQQVGPGGHL